MTDEQIAKNKQFAGEKKVSVCDKSGASAPGLSLYGGDVASTGGESVEDTWWQVVFYPNFASARNKKTTKY